MAVQMLKSLVSIGKASEKDYENFLQRHDCIWQMSRRYSKDGNERIFKSLWSSSARHDILAQITMKSSYYFTGVELGGSSSQAIKFSPTAQQICKN